ncbi:MAG: hypothetical protein ACR2G2_04460 [Pseudonocardia sp.]
MFVSGARRRCGLGRESFGHLAREAVRWPGITSWRAGILHSNAQFTGFWQRLGFVPTGEVKPHRYAELQTEVAIYTRPFPELNNYWSQARPSARRPASAKSMPRLVTERERVNGW